jgi:phosphoribosylaminoimidazole carboxylase PurE protein
MQAVIGIIMGSESDLATMRSAAEILTELSIPYEMDIVSAHRTPDKLHAYASTAEQRGLQVIIAGAGGAAHLPGMAAALTVLPVIGVPISATRLQGIDALLSIVQMPKGVPVATVAIDNAANAAFLAAQIIATCDPALRASLHDYRRAMRDRVAEQSDRLQQQGQH